jgi:hypothetical protein
VFLSFFEGFLKWSVLWPTGFQQQLHTISRITNSQTITHWPSEAAQPDSIITYLEREWQYLTHKHTNIIDNRYDLIPNTTAVDPPNRLVKPPSHKTRAKERKKKRRKLLHASTPNVHENTQS